MDGYYDLNNNEEFCQFVKDCIEAACRCPQFQGCTSLMELLGHATNHRGTSIYDIYEEIKEGVIGEVLYKSDYISHLPIVARNTLATYVRADAILTGDEKIKKPQRLVNLQSGQEIDMNMRKEIIPSYLLENEEY